MSRAALFAASAVGAAFATAACSPAPPYGTNPYVPSTDASASDGPSGTDAADAGTTSEPTDSSSTADSPSAVALYGAIAPPYGHVPVPDE